MSTSTVYDVKVRYALDDKATRGARNLAGEFDRAGRSALSLRGAIAGVGLAGVFMAGKRALIDFNSEVDQMKIGMTTIMNMQLKKPWAEASKSADGLFTKFQEMAKKSPATTRDFMIMANALTPVIASLGGGTDKIANITQGAVIAGLATGTRADVASLDVKQMLMGNVTERDMMAQQLISAKGMSKESFNDMDVAARASMVEEMLQDPALLRAADEFGKSFAGQVSTFKDQLQIALGTVGKPLMSALSAEVSRWNQWIEKHPRTIAAISAKIGGMLKSSFQFIGKTVGWLIEHKETLFTLGKIFLAFKGAQMATGLIGGFARGISNLTEGLKQSTAKITGPTGVVTGFGRLAGVISGVGGLLPAFAGLAVAAVSLWDVFTDWVDGRPGGKGGKDPSFYEALGDIAPQLDRKRQLDKTLAGKTDPRFSNFSGKSAFDGSSDLYNRLVTEQKALNDKFMSPEMWGSAIQEIDKVLASNGKPLIKDAESEDLLKYGMMGDSVPYFNDERLRLENLMGQQTVSDSMLELATVANAFAEDLTESQRLLALKYAYPDQFGALPVPADDPKTQWGNGKGGEKANINVTIHRIEVAADDPDRFVFGMVKALNNVSKNPTQAASAIGD